jgi:hypothetical protein
VKHSGQALGREPVAPGIGHERHHRLKESCEFRFVLGRYRRWDEGNATKEGMRRFLDQEPQAVAFWNTGEARAKHTGGETFINYLVIKQVFADTWVVPVFLQSLEVVGPRTP